MDVEAVARTWLDGRTSAVSLTYDGPDISHLETAVDTLERYELKGTFFVDPPPMLDRADRWQAVANGGHEMGCHPFFSSTDPRGNLWNWTIEMVEEELRQNKRLFFEVFPNQTDFSFAYPGDQTRCLRSTFDRTETSYREAIQRVFDIARCGEPGVNNISSLDLGWIRSFDTEQMAGVDLIELVEQYCEPGSWTVLRFGPIGVGDRAIDARAHQQLCAWLRDRAETIHVGTIFRTGAKLRYVQSV
ncbi:MAG: polysaccharide deacetylase family protein [Fimbriimonadaceae bacterium]|nr:polysaccharide deacetylase family protein [Fimbriimonadaceae bacterium]